MKWSRYNFIYKSSIGDFYFLFNGLSQSFIKIQDQVFLQYILDLKKGKVGIEDISGTALYDDLIKHKVVVKSDDLEIEKIKNRKIGIRYMANYLSLTILPTLDCNFDCPYCFANCKNGINITEETVSSVINLIKKYKETYNSYVSLCWMGGEPLSNFDAIANISNELNKLSVSYSSELITNGYLLTEDKIKLFSEYNINMVQVTIDGVQEEHNKTRVLKRNKNIGTFQKIIENLDVFFRLREYTKDISLNVRVNLSNKEAYLKKFISISNFLENRYSNEPNLHISLGFITDDNPSCNFKREEMRDFFIDLSKKGVLSNNVYYPKNEESCSIRSFHDYIIGPNGELYPCWEYIGDKKNIYGHISDEGWAYISDYNLFETYKYQADILNDKKCLKCFFFPICSGGCPMKRIHNTYSVDQHDVCCMQKGDIKNILDNYYLFEKNQLV